MTDAITVRKDEGMNYLSVGCDIGVEVSRGDPSAIRLASTRRHSR